MPTPSDATDRLHAEIVSREPSMRRDLERYVNIPTGFNHAPGLDELRGLVTERCRALGAGVETVPGEPRPDWVSPPSPGAGGESAGAAVAAPPSVICRGPNAGVGPSILIASHLDTVFDPAGPFTRFTLSPDGHKGFGPGVVDMKGGIVIALHALEVLAACGFRVNWTYFFNSDEETGTYHSAKALLQEAPRHAVGLATEPALPGGGLAVERKGSGQFLIEAFGRSAHAGRDFEKGASAVYALARAVTAAEGLTDLPRGVTVNIGPLKGGEATNIVPDYAAAWGNVRFPTPADSGRFEAGFSRLNTGADADAPRVRARFTLNRPAKPLTPGTQRLAEFAAETATLLGQSMTFASTGGVCDGNLMQAAGLPTIDSLGVCGGGLHTHDEWIEMRSLTERCELLARLLLRLTEAWKA